MENVYTLNEAAERLKIPVGTLRKYQREIGFSKLGRTIVMKESDLVRWINKRYYKPVQAVEGQEQFNNYTNDKN